MQVGERAIYWHLPLVARLGLGGEVECFDGALGHFTAEREGAPDVELWPRYEHRARRARRRASCSPAIPATAASPRRATRARCWRRGRCWTAPLAPSLARAMVHTAREVYARALARWTARLRAAPHPDRAELAPRLAFELRELLGDEQPVDAGAGATFRLTRGREFEERYWQTIAELCEGGLREKNNADVVALHAPPRAAPPAMTARSVVPSSLRATSTRSAISCTSATSR